MERAVIKFDVDPQSGKRSITISYQSEPDALPMEHEADHRHLVDQLIEGGVISASEAGKVRIERESAANTSPEKAHQPDSLNDAVEVEQDA